MDGRRIFVTRLVNTCWSAFRGVLALAAVLAIALGAFLYFRFDAEAQRLSEHMLNKHLAPFTARVGSASYTPGRGFTMRNLEIVEPVPWRAPRGVMQIDEVTLEGDFDLGSLLSGKPRVRRVVLKSPKLAATRRRDRTWNLADLKPPPPTGGPTPKIEVRDATVVLLDEEDAAARLALHHLGAQIESAPDGSGDLIARLTARDTLARSAEVKGRLSKDGAALQADYEFEGVAIDGALLRTLRALGLLRTPVPAVRGLVSAKGSVARGPDGPPQWDAAFRVDSGEYRLASAPRPLNDITITGQADNAALRIDRGTARWGDTPITLAASRNGWGLFAPFVVRLRAENYDLASTPVNLLPGDSRKVWDRFKPLGRVNAEADLTFDGARFTPRATITALDASFEDSKEFPYRLTGATGRLLLNGGVSDQPARPNPNGSTINLDFRGQADGAMVSVTGELTGLKRRRPGQREMMPLGWIDISGDNIPISDRLVGAITSESARGFVQSLHPAGKIYVHFRVGRQNHQAPKPDVSLDIRLIDCRMIYDKFPYPLSGVTGWVRQLGDKWSFYELRSRDARGRTVVEGQGTLEPREGSCGFELTLTGNATPLDQTLYDALGPGAPEAQSAWALVRPNGQIDFEARITRNCGEPAPRVRLKMSPHQRDLTIAPPLSESGHRYRLERVDGEFEWADDRLTMRRARAEHGRTHYTTEGTWESLNGAWKLDLVGLNADKLELDREFLLAAPTELRSAIESLRPRGVFDLFDSQIELTQPAGSAGPVQARWKVNVNCHQVAIDAGVPLDGISGVISLGGSTDRASAYIGGELDLDSVFWNDLQLTQVQGPLWANSTDLFLGEGVAREVGSGEKRPVSAKSYGGDVRLNSWVRYGGQTRYGVAIGMTGVDVTRLSSEWLRRPEALDGLLDGTLELRGVGPSIYGLTGQGQMAVRDADLYELPLFLSLLKYLRNRTPDTTAFDRLETQFTLEGNDLAFERFDLLGDAVNLYGKGTATLERDVDLTFASVIGRSQFDVPVLRAFVSSASEQLLRLRMTGPLDAPEVRREVLPMVGNVIEQLQADFGGRVTQRAPLRGAAASRR